MKVRVNIELWDNTTMSKLEEVGLTTKFLAIMYHTAFEQLVKEICNDAEGMEHTVSVEIVDNAEE